MSQPIPKIEAYDRADELLKAVGVERSELPVELYDLGIRHVYVGLPSEEAVAALEPDLNTLVHLTGIVGVNCFAGSGKRWKNRMFAPADGVAEDPATGSAAGPLAVHLARHGRIAFGDEIEISQGTEVGRPSTLYARAEGTPDQHREGRVRRLRGHRRPRRVQLLDLSTQDTPGGLTPDMSRGRSPPASSFARSGGNRRPNPRADDPGAVPDVARGQTPGRGPCGHG